MVIKYEESHLWQIQWMGWPKALLMNMTPEAIKDLQVKLRADPECPAELPAMLDEMLAECQKDRS